MNSKHDAEAALGCVTCEFEPFVRNNYFTGKMMGASDFIAETHFHQEKMRLHQARLHGWGVVCGLNVFQHPNQDCQRRYVRVEPGSAVDCCGHDILVPEEEMLDLLTYKKVAELAKEDPRRIHALGICVRYVECPTENVPVLYDDCGCDDNGCAPNRILESYAFDVTVDPALTPLPRVQPAELASVVFARAAEASLGANTPRFGNAPLVGNVIYALDAKQPQKLITFDLATHHAGSSDLGADAMAVAGRGNFAFVATGPKAGTTDVIQVFSPASPTVVATIDITGTTSANTVALAASSDVSRAAIVYVRQSGALLAYAEDGANGLKSASTSLGSITASLTSFVAKSDGSAAYAIDEAAGKLKAITLASSSSATDATALPATAKPSALAYLETGGKTLIAVASRTTKSLFILDAANLGAAAGLLATLTLDHVPEFVASGADGMLYAIEESGTTTFVQAAVLAPLATGQPAILTAPRPVPGTGLRLIGLLKNAGLGVVVSDEQIEIACADLIWHQDCHSCDTPNCIMLASIERYQAGASVLDAANESLANDLAAKRARIDNRAGRKILASTQTLQAWLECLQTRGTQGPKGDKGQDGKDGTGTNGAPGKDGIGFYPDLPKILDIGWRFEERRNINQFTDQYMAPPTAPVDLTDLIVERIKRGRDVPPLTVYFNREVKGVTRRTLEVRIDAPMSTQEGKPAQAVSSGVYFPIDLRMYGDIVQIPGPVPTPHTGEIANFAVTFIPRRQFFWVFDSNNQPQAAWPYLLLYYLINANMRVPLDLPRVNVSLKGNFVFAPDAGGKYTEFGVLDGDNIGGQVGEPPPAARQPPILGGKNPSGNLTQGGLFESWFFLTQRDSQGREQPQEVSRLGEMFRNFTPEQPTLERMPTLANFSSAEAIVAATGVSDAVARRIAAARERQPFADADDFRSRAGISERDWAKLDKARREGKLLIL
ncbi:hypothetical protein [Bradyrhizobium liaoningense]|uniref:hypothetical protein n=1 Tax=Bradyrhizobium liaoningense TaxID=43992 RepID=UPI001BA76E2C|nr:hypothetical protein [Bradyrhizobium liaoningense]MBR0820225.1 hypothetical protein [Bradyrhizobium liaoningense]